MTDTSKLRATEGSHLVALLNDMADRKKRHDYSIGEYWNAVDEAAEHIQRLERQRDELAEAVREWSREFKNRGEQTSLHVWNARLLAVEDKTTALLAQIYGDRK